MKRLALIAIATGVLQAIAFAANTYYIDPAKGNDRADGRSPQRAWRSMEKANSIAYASGDRLLLKRGAVFSGTLALRASGREGAPVVVEPYGEGEMPVIDAKGHVAGISLTGCNYLEIDNVAVSSDGGQIVEPKARGQRYGVLITGDGGSRHVFLRGLYIHDILGPKNNKNGTGDGIHVEAGQGNIRDLLIEKCRIERTAAIGIALRGRGGPDAVTDIRILDNQLKDIGGPGIQPSRVARLVARGNVVDGSGSSVDKRMRGRGSGLWPWGSEDVLIERNTFMHARGAGDSCGIHIDFNCRNVVVQYNLSVDNAGGFVEILGNDYNCAYRYNVSINDGFRIKGQDGAIMDGKTLWLSSFTGPGAKRCGPFNSYIYNNTIYVKGDIRSAFSITRTSDGALIANNIFYIPGRTENVGDDQDNKTLPPTAAVRNVIFKNNLYLRAHTLPGNLPLQDGRPLHDLSELLADPKFKNPGGVEATDYIPGNIQAVQHKGIRITPLPGDSVGLKIGLEVNKDFFGNPIVGLPDLGAIEITR